MAKGDNGGPGFPSGTCPTATILSAELVRLGRAIAAALRPDGGRQSAGRAAQAEAGDRRPGPIPGTAASQRPDGP